MAFDEEMTGIRLDNTTEPAWGDKVDQRYLKMKRVTEHFMLMQVGICVFHEEEIDEMTRKRKNPDGEEQPGGEGADSSTPTTRLVARPFNFYVFPPAKSGRELRMTANTAHFHIDHMMDFNKWIKHGVPFMTAEQYDKAAAQMLEKDTPHTGGGGSERRRVSVTRDNDVSFINSSLSALEDWVNRPKPSPGDGGAKKEKEKEGQEEQEEEDSFELPQCNAFLRRALFEGIETKFPDLWVESRAIAGSNQKSVVAVRMTPAQRQRMEEEKRRARLADLDCSAGFVRVWKLLAAARKPVVGHNCLYDLMFLYSHFQVHATLLAIAQCCSTHTCRMLICTRLQGPLS